LSDGQKINQSRYFALPVDEPWELEEDL